MDARMGADRMGAGGEKVAKPTFERFAENPVITPDMDAGTQPGLIHPAACDWCHCKFKCDRDHIYLDGRLCRYVGGD